MSRTVNCRLQVSHGPNTLENFHQFSLESVIEELPSNAPDVFQLLTALCTMPDADVSPHQLIVTAMVTLLKSLRQPAGSPTLLTFTLIARATSKQVRCQQVQLNTIFTGY